jgi:hypothetical protein
VRNSLGDLNDYLFEQIERVNDDGLTGKELDEQLKKAKAVVEIGKTIVQNANVVLRAAIASQVELVQVPETIVSKEQKRICAITN